jgi:hypothetical protein
MAPTAQLAAIRQVLETAWCFWCRTRHWEGKLGRCPHCTEILTILNQPTAPLSPVQE